MKKKERVSTEELQAFASAMQDVNWRDPEQRYVIATKIVKWVKEDIYNDDIIGAIADVETFKEGEEVKFHTLQDLIAYIHEPGSYAPRSVMTKTEISLPTQLVSVATELDIGQLRSGRYGTIADLRDKASEALLGRRNKLLWETTYGAVTSSTTDSNYATFSSSAEVATKRAALDAALTFVHDNAGQGPKAIIGRYTALSWLPDLGSDYFSDQMKDELNRTGYLGSYKGVPVYYLRSYKDRNKNQFISASHIVVVGPGNIKFGIVDPGLEVYEQLKGTTTRGWEIAFWEKYGCAVVSPETMYHLEIT